MIQNLLHSIDAEGIATITLNRPEVHNAFDNVLIHELLLILRRLEADAEVKVIVLKAAGKNFSAGADLNWMRRMVGYSYEENLQDARVLSDLMHTLKFLAKPVIARVQGAVYGGGVGLVACCDIAVASTDAIFCLSEVRIGLTPSVISPYIITAIGERAARRYCLTAEQISAQEALRLGLVAEVTPLEQLDATLQQIISHLLQNGPQAVVAVKSLINRVSRDPYGEENVQKNAELIAVMRVSAEGQEGLTAFLEKRTPSWK